MMGDPHVISPRGEWFAWRPVRLHTGGWAWMRRVWWFRPLGLVTEYYELAEIHQIATSSGGVGTVKIARGKMTLLDFKPATLPGSPDEQSGSQPPQDPSAPKR